MTQLMLTKKQISKKQIHVACVSNLTIRKSNLL